MSNQTQGKRNNIALLLAIVGAGALLSVAACVGLAYYGGLLGGLADSPKVRQEALAYAQAHDQVECLTEALKRGQRCERGDSALSCHVSEKLFLSACFAHAAKNPQACDGAPGAGHGVQETTKRLEAFVQAQCAKQGSDPQGYCLQYVQVLAVECQNLSREGVK